MGDLLLSKTALQFAFVTCVLGGGAAWFAGSAIARTWRPLWHVALYMLLLGAAVRFVHFALFVAPLFSVPAYALDALYVIAVGSIAWRATRTTQMVTQYDWLYERTGPFTWRPRAAQRASGRDPSEM